MFSLRGGSATPMGGSATPMGGTFQAMIEFYHQKFQVPKIEVMKLIRLFRWWVFPSIIRETYNLYRLVPHCRYLKCLVNLCGVLLKLTPILLDIYTSTSSRWDRDMHRAFKLRSRKSLLETRKGAATTAFFKAWSKKKYPKHLDIHDEYSSCLIVSNSPTDQCNFRSLSRYHGVFHGWPWMVNPWQVLEHQWEWELPWVALVLSFWTATDPLCAVNSPFGTAPEIFNRSLKFHEFSRVPAAWFNVVVQMFQCEFQTTYPRYSNPSILANLVGCQLVSSYRTEYICWQHINSMHYMILPIVHFLFFLNVMKLPESPTKIWSLPTRLTIQSRPLHHLLLCKKRCSEDVRCSRQRGGVSWWCFGWGMRSPMGHLTSAWYFVS